MNRLERRLLLGFGAIAILATAVLVFAYVTFVERDEAGRWVRHTIGVINDIDSVTNAVHRAELGVRAHLLEADDAPLVAYREAEPHAFRTVRRLRAETRDNAVQQRRLVRLETDLRRYFRLTDGLLRRHAARAATSDRHANRGLERIMASLEPLRLTEVRLLAKRQRTLTVRRTRALGTLFGLTVLMAALLGASFVLLRHYVDQQRRVARAHLFLDAIVENLPLMLFVKTASRLAFERFNRAGEQLLGKSRDELLGRTDYDFFPPEEAAFFQKKDREALESGELIVIEEERIETASGSRWLHTRKVPIADESGRPAFLLGLSEDITERKLARDRLLASEARFRAMFEETEDAILLWEGRASTILHANPSALQLFGVSLDTVVGRPRSAIVADDAPLESWLRSSEAEPSGRFESSFVRGDGSTFDGEVSVAVFRDADRLQTIMILRDVTSRNEAERALRKAHRDAEAANRELEAFSYSVSHDLRGPLRSIDGFSQALLEDYHDTLDETGQDFLRRVRAATQRMGQLIDDLINLSRVSRDPMTREHVDLSALAQDITDELRRADPARRVEVRIEPKLVVEGDGRLVRVALENLLGNAWKFTSKQPAALIEVGCTSSTREARCFFVRDNGAGFNPTYARNLFGAFQRLHSADEFEGTGIGLATVKRVVNRHGGRVWAHGEVGRGAAFYFTLETPDAA